MAKQPRNVKTEPGSMTSPEGALELGAEPTPETTAAVDASIASGASEMERAEDDAACPACGALRSTFYPCCVDAYVGAGYQADTFEATVADGKRREAEAAGKKSEKKAKLETEAPASAPTPPRASKVRKGFVRCKVISTVFASTADDPRPRMILPGTVADFEAGHDLESCLEPVEE